MKRYIKFAVSSLLAALLLAGPAWAQLGGGFGGGIGGGMGGGGGGFRGGGGATFRSGGGAMYRGSAPAIRSGGTATFRSGAGLQAGGTVRAPARATIGVQPSVRAGTTVRVPSTTVRTPSAAVRVPSAAVGTPAGTVRTPATTARLPSTTVRTPGTVTLRPQVNANGQVTGRVDGAVQGRVNAVPGVNAGMNTGTGIRADVNARTGAAAGTGVNARTGVGAGVNAGTGAAAGARVGDVRGRVTVPGVNAGTGVGAGVNARTGVRADVNAGAGAATRAQINDALGLRAGANVGQAASLNVGRVWQNLNLSADQTARLNTNLNTALRAAAAADVNANVNAGVNANTNVATNVWLSTHPQRAQHWSNWGGGVRSAWGPSRYGWYFGPRFWATHNVFFPGRYGYYWWGARPAWYWWTAPGWYAYAGWFPGWGWNAPYYYDYGPGGNVVYMSDGVYVNDQLVGTSADYAASAAALASVDPTAISANAEGEFLPIGTFAISTSANEKDPSRVIQLAVDKNGIVTGTMFNTETDKTFPVVGRVDKDTQRVAFTIGDNKDVVLETGLFNLTQEQTPVLVHNGPDQNETYLFARLEHPEAGKEQPMQRTESGGLLP